MGEQVNDPNETSSSQEQRHREHLEGVERERIGLPYSKDEFLRNLRFVEELHQQNQQALREYGDYTFTILVLARELDLDTHHEWDTALRQAHNQRSCKSVAWGRDLRNPLRVLVLSGKWPLNLTFGTRLLIGFNCRMVRWYPSVANGEHFSMDHIGTLTEVPA